MKPSLKTYLPSEGINNELELERALLSFSKLRVPSENNAHFHSIRSQILKLIVAYEKEHWNLEIVASEYIILESDLAEIIVRKEEEFIQKRRKLIKTGLSRFGLKQKDLCELLDHKSETYISDLIRGWHPMSITDMLIISKVLKISMNDLVPKNIPYPVLNRLSTSLKKMNRPGLTGEILELATA